MLLVGDFIPQRFAIKLPDEFRRQLVLANLEGPICTDEMLRSDKVGICLHTTTSEQLMREVRTFAFSLANNHMMDFREAGLRQTQETLAANGIAFAGAGKDETEARKPMILNEDGKRIAVFCCCERQFGMATQTNAGCAEAGLWLYDAIREVRRSGSADFVIVSCHAASEFSPWVSPELHDFYHSLIDIGADCIHGHHAHVPQGVEEYRRRPIFYGLGNFIVDPAMWNKNSHQLWSFVADVRFSIGTVEWHVRPYSVSRIGDVVSVCPGKESGEVDYQRYLANANAQFSSRESLQACWQEAACALFYNIYGRNLRSPPVTPIRIPWRDRCRLLYFALWEIFRAVTGRDRPSAKSIFYAKVLYNSYNCKSHTDMIKTALGVFTNVESDMRTEVTKKMWHEFCRVGKADKT